MNLKNLIFCLGTVMKKKAETLIQRKTGILKIILLD